MWLVQVEKAVGEQAEYTGTKPKASRGASGPPRSYPLTIDSALLGRSSEVGDALWLVAWAFDRTTTDCLCPDGKLLGLVLGGKPVKDAEIARQLRRPLKWVRRVRRKAVRLNLLRMKRCAYGNILLVVLSWRKFPKRDPKPAPAWADRPKRVPRKGHSQSQKGTIQSAQNRPGECPIGDTLNRPLHDLYTEQPLQSDLAPSPLLSPTGGETSARQKNAEHPLSPEANSSEPAKPAKPLYELRVDQRFLTAFGQIVAHFARELENDVRSTTQASVERARELKLQIPPDPEHFVRRIIGKSNAGE